MFLPHVYSSLSITLLQSFRSSSFLASSNDTVTILNDTSVLKQALPHDFSPFSNKIMTDRFNFSTLALRPKLKLYLFPHTQPTLKIAPTPKILLQFFIQDYFFIIIVNYREAKISCFRRIH